MGATPTSPGGAIRFAYDGLDDVKTLVPELSQAEIDSMDVGRYPQSQYYSDLMRVTEGLSDPDLAQVLVSQSFPHHALAP